MKAKILAITFLSVMIFGPRAFSAPLETVETSTATGDKITFDTESGVAIIEGNAKVVTSTAILKADKIIVNTKTKQGYLKGNVSIEQSSGTIEGSEIYYDWQVSTGMIYNAEGVSPPWFFQAEKMIQESRGKYRLYRGYLTSCDLDPPHYLIRMRQGTVETGKRATLKNSKFVVDETTAFWFPVYSRSLKPKKYRLRVEPGSSGRDGIITKTLFGYPFTSNSYTNLKWDYFQYTGNGFGMDHSYFLPNVRGNLNSYYIRDINPDPQPQSRRFDLNWNHYQKFSQRLTANAKIDYKSDQTFGNQFLGSGSEGRVENSQRGLISEGGLNYQFPRASIEAQFKRQDRFDSTVSSKSFIGKLVLPRLSWTTAPLKFQGLPFYTNFSAAYTNETQDRIDPEETLRYQERANAAVQIKKDFRVSRKWTLTPTGGYSQTWQERDFELPEGTNEIYQGRTNTGLGVRGRLTRTTDLNLNQNYVIRSQKDRWDIDEDSDDRGIETNQLTTSVVTRVGRSSLLTLSSGYDFRQAPRNNSSKYRHVSERISSPSLDLQYHATKNVAIFFREAYSLFDPGSRSVRRTPLNTSGEIQVSAPARSLYFSQGFNYSKTGSGADATLILNNKLRFYVTPHWYVDMFMNYQAIGPSGLNYKKGRPIERTVRVVRDLHCWILRMEFSERVGRKEASFYIDLKANLTPQKNIFTQMGTAPETNEPEDIATIFPEAPTEEPEK